MRDSRKGSVNDRFFTRFEVCGKTGCWNWTGFKTPKGYGIIGGEINGKRHAPVGGRILAHRASWILHNGSIPKGEGAHGTVVMHKCDNPSCVNPEHLRLGTQSDNVLDMIAKGRRNVPAPPSGIKHWGSSITRQEDIDFICSQKGNTKALAEKYGVHICTIKKIRSRNGFGSSDPAKHSTRPVTQEMLDHIRSTPPRTRGLSKLYGISNITISRIRNGLSHKS